MKNFPLQTFFFNLCTSANIFFLEMQTIVFTHILFASNLFCLFRPCKQKIVRPLLVSKDCCAASGEKLVDYQLEIHKGK